MALTRSHSGSGSMAIRDGIAECYYFDGSGYMLSNTTTPDGYVVNGDGAWTEGGAVKTKNVSTEPVTANTSNDTVTNSQAPATDVYSGTYAYNIGTYSFSMKIVYDPANQDADRYRVASWIWRSHRYVPLCRCE